MARTIKPFGKLPYRALESFGVAGLLSPNAVVFYSSLFTTRNIGRVSDLVCAKLALAAVGADELRLRALMLFSLFEAYRVGAREAAAGKDPMILECGFDEEKLAVGISFVPHSKTPIQLEGLADRVASGEPRDRFEALLSQIDDQSDRAFVRCQKTSGKIEIVAMVAIPGKLDRAEIEANAGVEVVVFGEGAAAEPQQPSAQYVELGDVNYAELLQDGTMQAAPAVTGEILARGGQARAPERPDVFRIKGVTQTISDERITVKGFKQSVQDETEITISAEKPAEKSEHKSVRGLLKRVWPFSGVSKEPSPETPEEVTESQPAPEPAPSGSQPEPLASAPPATPAPAPAPAPAAATPAPAPQASVPAEKSNAEAASTSLIVEIQAGSLDRTINKAQKESNEIKKELGSTRAKRWVDGLMGELVAEKARLHDFAKKLNQTIRQKELEFKNRERALEEELRRRDEMLRQKNSALVRAKEQASQMQVTMDRLKTASDAAQDDSGFKQKYQLSQKVLTQARDENMQLQKKVDDLRGQLATQQMIVAKSKTATPDAATQQRVDRLTRQVDEFKKANQQLMEKLAEAQKKTSSGNVDELKRRLELATKVSTVHQRESEQLRLRVEELQREETRVKSELAKVYAELKAIKASRPGGGGTKAA